MLVDIAKQGNSKTTGVYSRCKVCGRYYTWNCPTRDIYYDIKQGRKKAKIEPEHCGSSVCVDFWKYYIDCNKKEQTDIEFAKYMYLKRKEIIK